MFLVCKQQKPIQAGSAEKKCIKSYQLAPGTSRRWYSGLNGGLQKDMSIFESLKLVSVTLFGKRVCADVLKIRR